MNVIQLRSNYSKPCTLRLSSYIFRACTRWYTMRYSSRAVQKLPNTNRASSQKEVLVVVGSLSLGGGAEKTACSIAYGLLNFGLNPQLVTFYDWPERYEFDGQLLSFGEKYQCHLAKKICYAASRILRIRKLLSSGRKLFTISFDEANFYVLLAKRLFSLRQKTICCVQIDLRKTKPTTRMLSRILYPSADRVVCSSKAVEQILKKDFGLSNTTTIYNPLDRGIMQKANDQPRIQLQLSPLLITIGRLTYQKGQWNLIRAFACARREYPNAGLIILGEGTYNNRLTTLIEKCHLEKNVYLLGNVHNVYPYLRMADLFVFSSLFEGFGNVLLEALAMGLPIITPDCVGGPREIVSPDTPVEQQLTYPYVTPFGTLTAPLTGKVIWESPDHTPLTPEEEQLTESIINQIRNPSKPQKNVRDAHLHQFSQDVIFAEWLKLINRE